MGSLPENPDLVAGENETSIFDRRPVPDPTVLTTKQLAAAIDGLRGVVEIRLDGMDRAVDLLQQQANKSPTVGELWARFEERYIAVNKAFDHIDDEVKKRPNEIAEAAVHLRELIEGRFSVIQTALKGMNDISDQRFIRIDQQFSERDKRTDQLTLASSTAIAAALQAQKEAAGETQKSSALAIAKSEGSTIENIKQLQALFQTSIAGLSTQILDVKSRLDKGEGGNTGHAAARIEYRDQQSDKRNDTTDGRGFVFGVTGMVIGIGALVLTVITHVMK